MAETKRVKKTADVELPKEKRVKHPERNATVIWAGGLTANLGIRGYKKQNKGDHAKIAAYKKDVWDYIKQTRASFAKENEHNHEKTQA